MIYTDLYTYAQPANNRERQEIHIHPSQYLPYYLTNLVHTSSVCYKTAGGRDTRVCIGEQGSFKSSMDVIEEGTDGIQDTAYSTSPPSQPLKPI